MYVPCREVQDDYLSGIWRDVAGMRDKLIHNYFGVDYEVVWKTVIEDVPFLQSKIKSILEEEERRRD